MAAVFAKGVDLSGERPGARRDPGERPGPALPRDRPHAGQLRDRVLPVRDRRQQQLRAVGRGRRARRRRSGRTAIWKRMLAEYEAPPIDPGSTRRCSRSSPSGRRRSRLRGLRPGAASAAARRSPPTPGPPWPGPCSPRRSSSCRSRARSTGPRPCHRARRSPSRPRRRRGWRRRVDLAEQLAGARLPGRAPPVGPDGPRSGAPRRPARPARRRRGPSASSWSAAMPKEPGEYPDGLSLLRAMAELGHPLERARHPVLPAGPRVHRRPAPPRRRSTTRRRSRAT